MRTNLFIVGAPKTGTTSLHNILNQHPDICMSEPKEPMYFCTEIQRKSDNFHNTTAKYFTIRELNKYENCFKGYNGEKIIGESSTNYINDNEAPRNIYKYNTNAKIIIIIREPITFIKSWYAQLKSGVFSETANSLEKALSLENERRQGKKIPKNVYFPDILFYTDRASFSKYIKNYLEQFGTDKVKLILHDNLKNNMQQEYNKICDFLNINRHEIKNIQQNTSKNKQTLKAKQLIYQLVHNKISRKILDNIPKKHRDKIHNLTIEKFMKKKIENTELTKKTTNYLTNYFYYEVQELSKLTNTDLIEKWNYKN